MHPLERAYARLRRVNMSSLHRAPRTFEAVPPPAFAAPPQTVRRGKRRKRSASSSFVAVRGYNRHACGTPGPRSLSLKFFNVQFLLTRPTLLPSRPTLLQYHARPCARLWCGVCKQSSEDLHKELRKEGHPALKVSRSRSARTGERRRRVIPRCSTLTCSLLARRRPSHPGAGQRGERRPASAS